MVWPGEMVDPMVHLAVRVARALCAELPDTPVLAVFGVEEADQCVERVSVCALRVGGRRARGCDYYSSRMVLERGAGWLVGSWQG